MDLLACQGGSSAGCVQPGAGMRAHLATRGEHCVSAARLDDGAGLRLRTDPPPEAASDGRRLSLQRGLLSCRNSARVEHDEWLIWEEKQHHRA